MQLYTTASEENPSGGTMAYARKFSKRRGSLRMPGDVIGAKPERGLSCAFGKKGRHF